ncbi:unnamed protein product [Anisakis simplex]|uniref:Uncharacterized protein n=1 Tax=Anisakis simplex TaxID=6269 RepID=A0A0M3K2L3_ANISI|nr:unnamed protein product [Anisakis simplex]
MSQQRTHRSSGRTRLGYDSQSNAELGLGVTEQIAETVDYRKYIRSASRGELQSPVPKIAEIRRTPEPILVARYWISR